MIWDNKKELEPIFIVIVTIIYAENIILNYHIEMMVVMNIYGVKNVKNTVSFK